ncbi:TRAP transporter substrate-binding protein [Pigmentiphaga aceris]|uniref:TRAP transporter substrate-binding protein n=1 Tax=Pigmentiphaga aceris TaxID=1940612 RepID=A0A5C0B1G4_9BURK|nr:TRAP transporter substrate-binding protein [Pigmentiphaga aceris]QEI08639.1 TRAP transporter substrate-binding protein [Pigmentiphaga aceris]
MPISRRALLQTSALAMLGAAHTARAQSGQFTYKCAMNVPVTHPVYLRMVEAADRIKKQTDGQVVLSLFPTNQLGSDTDMLGQVRAGTLETVIMPGVVLANLVPMASLNSIGFAFKDYPTVWKAMDGGVGDQIRAHIRKTNLLVQDKVWDNGFRHMTSWQPVSSPADLTGRRVRVPVSPLLQSLFKSLGAATAPINFNELYNALQNRVIDAQENPLALISTAKLYEVQKYCALTSHVWDGYWFLSNRKAWESIPEATRKIVDRNLAESALAQRADNEQLASTLQAQLTTQGLTFSTPDTTPFRETLRKTGFYVDWKRKFGEEAWAALEKEVGTLV